MGDVPDFLKQDQAEEAARPHDLTELAPLVTLMKEQKAEVERLKAELEEAEAAYKKTAQQDVPAVMNYVGYSAIELASGERVKVKEDAAVSVPEDKEAAFFKFLADRGDQDIIKLQFAFPRMPAAKRQLLFDLLDANEFEFEFKEGVHPQTLKSYFKKLLGVGEEDREEGIQAGKYVHPDVVRDFTQIFVYYVTSITAPKVKQSL
jgi:hypothetical protein